MLFHVHILSFCEGLFLCSKGNNCGNCKDRLEKNVVQLSCSKHGKLNSLQFKKEKVLVYTLLGRHHTLQLHFTNMAAWSLSKCLTHWHPKHVFFFFCISPQCIFLSYCKAFNKKGNDQKFSNCFLPPLFARLCRSHNNKLQSAASQLPPKIKKTGLHFKSHGPASTAALKAEKEKPPFITSVLGHNGREVQPLDQGQGWPRTVCQPVSSQPAAATDASIRSWLVGCSV